MPQIVPIYYAPDIDNGWAAAPGALRDVTNFLPTAKGTYGNAGTLGYFGGNLATSAPQIGYMFAGISGTRRFLVAKATDIDEYDSSATKTNRGTGYNASTAMWSMAAYGNQIIATNYLDAPQSSTGAGFGALGGTPPKARHVLVQSNFVILFDYNDGVNSYGDGWACSGLGNSAVWATGAADLTTGANNGRLLSAPGPIRAVATLRDQIVAFKDDAIFVGRYSGNPYTFTWTMITNKIGCVAQHAVTDFGGVLYFPHWSGIYSFDGSQITNIGAPVFQTMMGDAQGIQRLGINFPSSSGGDWTKTQAVTDDIEGTILFGVYTSNNAGTGARKNWYGYNVKAGRWGKFTESSLNASGDVMAVVKCSFSDINSFKAQSSARALFIKSSGGTVTANYLIYPGGNGTVSCSVTTGMIGSLDKSSALTRIYARTLPGSQVISGGFASGYSDEAQWTTNGVATGVANTEFNCVDITISSRWRTAQPTWSNVGTVELAGIGLDLGIDSKR